MGRHKTYLISKITPNKKQIYSKSLMRGYHILNLIKENDLNIEEYKKLIENTTEIEKYYFDTIAIKKGIIKDKNHTKKLLVLKQTKEKGTNEYIILNSLINLEQEKERIFDISKYFSILKIIENKAQAKRKTR